MAALAAYACSCASLSCNTHNFHSLLPQPILTSVVSDDEAETQHQIPSQAVITRTPIPPYGKRRGWKPTTQEDFCWFFTLFCALFVCLLWPGDGGSYPECHVAQYPLNLGKKKVCMSVLHSSAYQLIQSDFLCRPKLATRLLFRLTRKATSAMTLSLTRVNGMAKSFSLSSKI